MAETRSIHAGWLAALLILLTFLCLVSAGALAADNGKIVFASDRSGSWQIYTVNPDGSNLFQVTNLVPTDDDEFFPSPSPDGRQIAFGYNQGEGLDVYVVNSDGTNLHQLTTDHGSFLPRWSPDGKRLVFTTVAEVRSPVIATMRADGSGRKILSSDLWESVGGVYTPDGKQIVFGSQMGGFVAAVWIMNVDGSHQRRLTPAQLRAQPWDVSPDGKQITGYTNQDSPPALGGQIFTMNLDGSGRKTLAPSSTFHHDGYPSFSPDSRKVAFISDRFSSDITEFTPGTPDVLTIGTDNTDLTVVVPMAGSCPFDSNCVSPFWGASPR